jgi:CspA family cold shock protein
MTPVSGAAGGGRRRGVVADFDDASGLGTIVGDDGARYRFHCVEIADGSRTIEVGAEVGFDLLAKFGSYEAMRVGQ